jgi:hypothetical protein
MADIIALPLSHASLDIYQQTMVDMLIEAMAEVRAGHVAGLSIARMHEDGTTFSSWAANSELAHVALTGATFRLTTEMALPADFSASEDNAS